MDSEREAIATFLLQGAASSGEIERLTMHLLVWIAI